MTDLIQNIKNESAMKDLARSLAPLLKIGDVVTLTGDLGAGKSFFSRALIRALSSEEEEVPSPTFTLVQTYDLPSISIWHFDLYRLEEKKADILELGWDEALRFGASLVEWPDRLGSLLPRNRLEIRIDFLKDSENERRVTLSPCGTWKTRLKEMS